MKKLIARLPLFLSLFVASIVLLPAAASAQQVPARTPLIFTR